MNKMSENRDFWIGRIFMIFFFFFVLSFSNRDSNSQIDYNLTSIEQVVDIHSSATLIEPISIPNYHISLVDHELYNIKISDNNFDIFLNSTVNHQFKCEELRFLNFKPKLLMLHLIPLKVSSKEDYSLIS
jgi:hypothetical protein